MRHFLVASLILVCAASCALLDKEPVDQSKAGPAVFPVPVPAAQPAPVVAPKKAGEEELKPRNFTPQPPPSEYESIPIRGVQPEGAKSSEELAFKIDELSRKLAQDVKDRNPELFVATFVDMDRLNRSATLGRYLAEQFMEKMGGLGFRVVETRESKRAMVQPNVGSQILEENPASATVKAGTVLSGTYKIIADVLIINAEIVAHKTQRVLSRVSTEMKIDKDDRFMREILENSLERTNKSTGK